MPGIRDLSRFVHRPELYEKGTDSIWTDNYISQIMLNTHLDPDSDGATRNIRFVRQSAMWMINDIARGNTLLDIGCGPGVYSEILAEAGFQVTGMDISKTSIDYAKNSAKERKLDINYINSDYMNMRYDKEFDTAIMVYCDFGVLSPDSRKRLLKNVLSALKPSGIFIFDVFNLNKFDGLEEYDDWEYFPYANFWSDLPSLCLNSQYIYEEDTTILNRAIVMDDRSNRVYNNWEHYFTERELISDLKDAGFSTVRLYGDIAGGGYKEGGETICAAAVKN